MGIFVCCAASASIAACSAAVGSRGGGIAASRGRPPADSDPVSPTYTRAPTSATQNGAIH